MKVILILIVIDVLGMILKDLVRDLEKLKIEGQAKTIQITKISQDTEKSPGDLRRLAVTQTPMKNHQLMLV